MPKEQANPFDAQVGPWWTRRGFLFGAAGGGLLLVLVVVVLVTTGGSPGSPAAIPPPVSSHGAGPGSTANTPVDEGPTDVPTSTPPDVRWEVYGGSSVSGVALPVSEKAGPHHIGASTATGYAHTPTGALLAASQIPVRKLLAPRWQDVVAQQVVPGPGRDAFAKARAQITDASVQPGQLGQLAGMKFVNYTSNTATIQLVSRFSNGKMQIATVTVQWSDGDWKEVLQPDGSDSPSAQGVSDLMGFIPWGGV
uniref:hypothetical protein n=1 Tax=Amycolatopsis sp. CA-151526 TaxID=3239921 RepID=UPI003F491D07